MRDDGETWRREKSSEHKKKEEKLYVPLKWRGRGSIVYLGSASIYKSIYHRNGGSRKQHPEAGELGTGGPVADGFHHFFFKKGSLPAFSNDLHGLKFVFYFMITLLSFN